MSTQMQEALSMGDARKEVVRDIYEEEKELFEYQIELKDALKDWLDSNLGANNDYLYGLIDSFNASSSKAPTLLAEIESHVKDLSLDEKKRQQLEDFLNALGDLVKAFEILRDFEISKEEIQQELANLKAEIVKPLRVKWESLNDVLSESSKVTLESLMSTREYQQFKKRFLSLRWVKNFLGEEEHDLDFDKNERYNIDADKLVKEVVGYMIDLGIVSKPEDLKKVFDEMKTVGWVFEYKQVWNAEVGKNALFVKVGDKIITIRWNYWTTDIKWMPWLLKAGVDKNLKEAATKLWVSPQKLKELLNFDGKYGKIWEERLSVEVKQGETIEIKDTILSQINISDEAKLFLESLFKGERSYNPENGKYGLFMVGKDWSLFITAPFVKVIENGKELGNTEKVKLYRRGLKNKNIQLVVDPILKNIKELVIDDSADGKTHIEIFSYTPEKVSYGGEKLFRNFENLPSEAVEFLNEHMVVDEKNKTIEIKGEEVPLWSRVVIFKKDGTISYTVEKGSTKDIIEFDYQSDTSKTQNSWFEIYKSQDEADSFQLPEELKNGIEITSDGVVIDLTSLSKVLWIDVKSADLDENLKIVDGKLVIPSHRWDINVFNWPDWIKITYEVWSYPLQLVYVNLEQTASGEVMSDFERKYEILAPSKIESLDKVKDISKFVDQHKLALAKLNMFDEYYNFINAYKEQNWSAAVDNLQKMLDSPKAKELWISSTDNIMQRIRSLDREALVYALALFVKGTLTDEYLLGEDLEWKHIDQKTKESIGREMLEIKKEGFVNHIKVNWGEDIANRLSSIVSSINPDKIDVSSSNRAYDESIVASLVYTKRSKEESFSLLPHGFGDVLEWRVVELNDLVLSRKILEKMPQDLLKSVLKNYWIDQYMDVNTLSKEEILELFMGKELVRWEVKLRIYGKPVYYLYGECINPTVGYRVEKVVIAKKENTIGKRDAEINIATRWYRLLQESTLTAASDGQSARWWVYFKGELSKTPSTVKSIGKVEVAIDQIQGGELNTIDVVPDQWMDWLYAIWGVDYTEDMFKRWWGGGPGKVKTRPWEDGEEIDEWNEGQTDEDWDSGGSDTGPWFTPGW